MVQESETLGYTIFLRGFLIITFSSEVSQATLDLRWAVFFDALGIKWSYKSKKISTDWTYGRYTPTFWLPTFSGGMFCEVKPEGGDFSAALYYCKKNKKSVWMCEGVPDFRAYIVALYDKKDGEVREVRGIPNADQASGKDQMFWNPGYVGTMGKSVLLIATFTATQLERNI